MITSHMVDLFLVMQINISEFEIEDFVFDKFGKRNKINMVGNYRLAQEEFEDTKGVIRIRISKKNTQHNDQKKKDKRTNNDIQNIHTKPKLMLIRSYHKLCFLHDRILNWLYPNTKHTLTHAFFRVEQVLRSYPGVSSWMIQGLQRVG